MRRPLPLLLISIAVLLSEPAFAQLYLEPFAGYQADINRFRTKMINSGLQLAFRKKKYEFLLQFQHSWPQRSGYTDSSFTLNPALPLYSPAAKTLETSSFSLAVGHRIKIAGRKTKNAYFIKLYSGITDQKTSVVYRYDKGNYTILNPDKTITNAGIFLSGGFEYMRKFENSRLFVELNFSSPPSGHVKYPVSFNLVAPVSINIGFSIQLSKK